MVHHIEALLRRQVAWMAVLYGANAGAFAMGAADAYEERNITLAVMFLVIAAAWAWLARGRVLELSLTTAPNGAPDDR